MRLLEINSVCGIKSTGRIVEDIAKEYQQKGFDVRIAYGREDVPNFIKPICYRIGSKLNTIVNAFLCRLFDNDGFSARRETRKFLKWAEEYNPDVLWLHNLHGYYINVPLLFKWIKSRPNMEVKWSLHDCWAFTGHCTHFSYRKCYKWQSKCKNCKAKNEYPRSIILNQAKKHFFEKKDLFIGISKMTLVVPSNWIANLVKKSFLKDYKILVKQHNVDTEIFKPTIGDFRKKHNLLNKKIVLGVASTWTQKKGLFDFYNLCHILPENYAIVMVGLTSKQIKKAPKQIIKIPKTDSKSELAEIYSSADVLLNPSKEETFGLTIVEAGCCGTPCIVLKDTACEETIRNYKGIVVEDSVEAMASAIIKITNAENNC